MDSQHPQKIELIGDYLAFVWSDGNESMIHASTLRENSPSAEQVGEMDIFGRIRGGSNGGDFSSVRIENFERVGNYAIRIIFSDGHASGIYSWDLLRSIALSTEEK